MYLGCLFLPSKMHERCIEKLFLDQNIHVWPDSQDVSVRAKMHIYIPKMYKIATLAIKGGHRRWERNFIFERCV